MMTWRLLIVEDDDDIADSLGEILAARGYRICRARDGREAIDTVKQHSFRPEAILLDLVMPVMGGAEFLRARPDEQLLAKSPVIVMTAQRDALRRLPEPVYACLTKPASLQMLIDTVHRACHSMTCCDNGHNVAVGGSR